MLKECKDEIEFTKYYSEDIEQVFRLIENQSKSSENPQEIDWDKVLLRGLNTKGDCDRLLYDSWKQRCYNQHINNYEDWEQLVNYIKDFLFKTYTSHKIESSTLENNEILKIEDINGLKIDEKSNFNNYLRGLESKNYRPKDIEEIRKSVIDEFRNLSLNTEKGNPRIGLVVGNVQSGKTANMAGLMALAADNGFNFFVVLTGLVENLRIQTKDRLINDLKTNYIKQNPLLRNKTNENWKYIDKLEGCKKFNDSAEYDFSRLCLDENDSYKYFTTVLKEKKTLESLIKYFNSDQNNKQKLKVLIIDDESDLASLDSSSKKKSETSTINKYLRYLTYGLNHKGEEKTGYKCMNYVQYTATPYGVLFNTPAESELYYNPKSEYSLYPKDFIKVLASSNLYIGGNQIFGDNYNENHGCYESLDVVRIIDESDCDIMSQNDKDLTNGLKLNNSIPKSLIDALCWFLCCAAALRYRGDYNHPVTMLIHTSRKIQEHGICERLVESWFNTENNKLNLCRDIYNKEIKHNNKQSFKEILSNYNDGVFDDIKDLPSFDEITPFLLDIISANCKNISFDDTGNRVYDKTAVHICVDNSEEEEYKKIVYPDSDHAINQSTPAFIVIGGNTLSRGLTLKGLVCSYFYRESKQMDTNIQMARWYGYKQGIELLFRIWLTEDAIEKFSEFADIDQKLRERLYDCDQRGISPLDYSEIYMSWPQHAGCKPTSANKSKGMAPVNISYLGTNVQTTFFRKDEESLLNNIDALDRFLSNIGDPLSEEEHKKYYDYNKNILWKDVPQEYVISFLKEYKYSGIEKSLGKDNSKFLEWLSKQNFSKWNVVIPQLIHENNSKSKLKLGDLELSTVNRSAKNLDKQGNIFINSIQQPNIKLADVENKYVESFSSINDNNLTNNAIAHIRNVANRGRSYESPLLIIYIIDKNSKAKSEERYSLNLNHHLIGLQIFVPGANITSKPKTVNVGMSLDKFNDI